MNGRSRSRRCPSHREAARVCLISLGCPKNQVDSERILGRLAESGALVCESPADADVIVVNTCAFIEAARQESLAVMREVAAVKRAGRCRRVVVVGCFVELRPDELRAVLPDADAFVGVGDADAVVRACGVTPRRGPPPRLRFGLRHVGYLRISDGCDNQCAYCTIPLIRGPLRSRPPQAVFAEARQLVADGARELVLIGQDTTSYGADRGAPCLPRLIEGIAARAGDAWLRLMYAHPAHFTDDVIAVWSRVPTLCPYVDLPLQHLADPILRRMGRSVTQRQVLGLIERLRSCVPDVAIRTTLIVGFPGETDALFQEMLRRVEAVGFDHLGAFAYSREPGTRAARLRSQVPEGAKRDRLRELMALQKRVVRRRNRSWIGREADILIDALKGDHDAVGRMRSQAPEVDGMTFLKAAATPGRVVRGRIVAQDGYDLVATPVSAASAGHRPG